MDRNDKKKKAILCKRHKLMWGHRDLCVKMQGACLIVWS